MAACRIVVGMPCGQEPTLGNEQPNATMAERATGKVKKQRQRHKKMERDSREQGERHTCP